MTPDAKFDRKALLVRMARERREGPVHVPGHVRPRTERDRAATEGRPGPEASRRKRLAEGPTEIQINIYKFIFSTIEREGRRPTYRELMKEFGYATTNSVTGHLKGLQLHGYIALTRDGRKACYDLLKRPDGGPFLGFLPIAEGS